jgi:hypothetical protein
VFGSEAGKSETASDDESDALSELPFPAAACHTAALKQITVSSGGQIHRRTLEMRWNAASEFHSDAAWPMPLGPQDVDDEQRLVCH